MRKLLTIFFVFLFGGHAFADSGLKTLQSGADSRGWEAVGRLDFAGRSFCTGTMISERLVLTAAHCMFDIYSHRAHKPKDVTFKAGWRHSQAQALRTARAIYVHPGFSLNTSDLHDRLVHDVALVELDQPIRNADVRPFATSGRPQKGQSVGVVSYAHDRAESAALQEVCHIVARQGGVLVTSCEVDFGSSGAPIFDMSGATPRIVSVVSAKANFQGNKVSVGASLDGSLSDLLQLADNGLYTPSSDPGRYKKAALDSRPDLFGTEFVVGTLGQ